MAPTNEERKNDILGQHVRLRATIHSVEQVARASVGAAVLSDELKAATSRLQKDVLEHLASEERLLEAGLSANDGREQLQFSLLRAEHAHQRAVLAMLNGGLVNPSSDAIATRTLELCAYLLADMEFEERELLGNTLLPPEI